MLQNPKNKKHEIETRIVTNLTIKTTKINNRKGVNKDPNKEF